MDAAWGRCRLPTRCPAIAASLACQVSSKVPFNDLAALHAAVDSRTVAIMLEPIQGEAG